MEKCNKTDYHHVTLKLGRNTFLCIFPFLGKAAVMTLQDIESKPSISYFLVTLLPGEVFSKLSDTNSIYSVPLP